MLLWTHGKWVPGKHKIFLESLLHMVHVIQSSQKLRLASKKSSIFSELIFLADVGEIRHLMFFLDRSWARVGSGPSELLYRKYGCLGPQRVKISFVFPAKSTSPKWVSSRSTNQSESPSWPKMAMMRISPKMECWKKSAVANVKVASGPYTFPLRSHGGPSWA